MTEWLNYSVVSQCSAFVKAFINVKSWKTNGSLFFFRKQMWPFFPIVVECWLLFWRNIARQTFKVILIFFPTSFQLFWHTRSIQAFQIFIQITFLNAFITFLNIIQIQYSRSAAGCILHLSEFEISYNETKFWSHIWKFSLEQNVFSLKIAMGEMGKMAMLTSCWFHGNINDTTSVSGKDSKAPAF